MSTSSSNSSLNYMSAAMPVALPPGFAKPRSKATGIPIPEFFGRNQKQRTPAACTPIQEFFGQNQKQRVKELEERVMELEIENDNLKTGMHNCNVERNEADDRIDVLERQVDDLIRLVAQLIRDIPSA